METAELLLVLALVMAAAGAGWYLLRARREKDTAAAAPSPPSRPAGAAALASALRRVWGKGLTEETWDELEEVLIAADVGVGPAERVVDRVRKSGPRDVGEARTALAAELREELGGGDRGLRLEGRPAVILVVGVNGTGKTTTIAKLARRLRAEGRTVLLAAADTFRAAAGAQLGVWADRLGVEVVAGEQGGDPASVVFDAVASARSRGVEVVIVDTAGRLHGKRNLMAELAKMHRVAAGERGRVDEVLLVLDASAGQNGLVQVEGFAEAVPVTGIVLTKMDGTAKGGIVVAVERRFEVPVKFVGLGEGLDDLVPFDPDAFVAELVEQT